MPVVRKLSRLWLKCIVGQSWAKLGKVDMSSKEVIKKQSWQSWYIFLFLFKHHMQSKVGKVQIWIFYSRQRWQSWDIIFLINLNNSDPKQSWQSWGYFWTNFASFYNRQSWQSWEIFFLINWNNSPKAKLAKLGIFLD